MNAYVIPGIRSGKKINYKEIIGVVCSYYGIPEEDVVSKKRYMKIVLARHVATLTGSR